MFFGSFWGGCLLVMMAIFGFLGIFLPILPGLPLIWLPLFIYAYVTDFAIISLTETIIFLVLTVIVSLIDILAPVFGAKRYSATHYGLWGSFFGFFFGVMLFGPFGVILGPLLGAFIGEYVGGATPHVATQSAIGTFVGFLAGTLLKFMLAIIMVGFTLYRFVVY